MARYLKPEERHKRLCELRSISKGFNAIIEPSLFSKIIFKPKLKNLDLFRTQLEALVSGHEAATKYARTLMLGSCIGCFYTLFEDAEIKDLDCQHFFEVHIG